jgi:hypothetical protein
MLNGTSGRAALIIPPLHLSNSGTWKLLGHCRDDGIIPAQLCRSHTIILNILIFLTSCLRSCVHFKSHSDRSGMKAVMEEVKVRNDLLYFYILL